MCQGLFCTATKKRIMTCTSTVAVGGEEWEGLWNISRTAGGFPFPVFVPVEQVLGSASCGG